MPLPRHNNRGQRDEEDGEKGSGGILGSPWTLAAGASGRWALGTLVLVALAASEISGVGTVAALPIAALTITLAALCHEEIKELNGGAFGTVTKSRQERDVRDLFDFLGIWFDMLTQLTAVATCARIVSATMNYMSDGRSSDWLFGYQSHSLGEPWPDILGIAIVVVITAMFMLGLENSTPFYILLNSGIIASVIFFISLGSAHADISYWAKDSFLPEGWSGMLTAAAMSSFGFVDLFPDKTRRCRKLKIGIVLIVPLLTFCTIAIMFTLMTPFRELSSAVPMVRVFEARDVDWARPVMASCTILVVSVAMMEFFPAMYALILTMASHEWNILTHSLAYESDTTGSPVLAIFTAGSLSAILAFACPLSYLVRLLNVGPLLVHTIQAAVIIYHRYQPDDDVEDFPVYTDVEYSRLNQSTSKTMPHKKEPPNRTVRCLKTGFWFLPRTLRQSRPSRLNEIMTEPTKKSKNGVEERECLLMGEYSPEAVDPEAHHSLQHSAIQHSESTLDFADSDSDSECNDLTTMTVKSSDAEPDEDSATDIDAVVEEYKELLKVATTMTASDTGIRRLPSLTSGRRVLVSVVGICICSVILGVGALFEQLSVVWASLSGIVFLVIIIAVQPQKKMTPADINVRPYKTPLMPWLPVLSIVLNALLAVTLMPEIWPGVILWLGAGLLLFLRCDQCFYCWDCDTSALASPRERIRLRTAPRGSIVSALLPNHPHHLHHHHSHRHRGGGASSSYDSTKAGGSSCGDSNRRITHVDTILIAR